MKKILMVCTGNTCRSVMAAAIFRQLAVKYQVELEIDSAGLAAFAGDNATPQAQQVLQEDYGVDLSRHQSQHISDLNLADYDLVLVMTQSHKQHLLSLESGLSEQIFLLTEFANQNGQECTLEKENLNQMDLDISDPFGQSVAVYRRTAGELHNAIEIILCQWAKEDTI